MTARHINYLIFSHVLLHHILLQRTIFAHRLHGNTQQRTNFNSHSQVMSDMMTWEIEKLMENDTKFSDLNRERRYPPYYMRNGSENETRAQASQKNIEKNQQLCLFKPTKHS